ncbi:MAG: hypothetical protein ABR951_05635 [Candidatus Aminicenantales bacterium]|jgi:hypothetical protein
MIAVLVCLLAMLVFQLLTPFWWWIMIVPFAYGVAAAHTGGGAFFNGFLSAGLLWLGSSLCFFLTGSGIITARVVKMFGLGGSWLMIPATALVAAIAAAVSGYAGYAVRALVKRK